MGLKSQSQLKAKFGNPTVDALGFERKWMKLWDIPDDINKAIPALPNKMYVNTYMVAPLEATFRALIAAGVHTEIRTYDGCFVIRKMRGLSSISLHSFGLAVDLNAAWNPLKGKVTWSKKFLQVWRDNLWTVGADWPTRTDGMHFQWDGWL